MVSDDKLTQGSRLSRWLLALTVILIAAAEVPAANPLVAYPDCTLVSHPTNDGDSFLVRTANDTILIRLYFADCCEMSADSPTDARRVRAQRRYFGTDSIEHVLEYAGKAKQRTEELLAEPFTVHTALAQAPRRSKRERYYAFVSSADGRDLACTLVAEGLARAYGIGRGTPDGRSSRDMDASLVDAELAAAMSRRGIWSCSDPERIVALRAEQRTEDNDLARIQQLSRRAREPEGVVDLNTAAEGELVMLHGIGPALAARIIAARPFKSVADIERVPGIGPKTLERIRAYVIVELLPPEEEPEP